MSYASNYSWGTQDNKPVNNKKDEGPGLKNWQQFGTNTQGFKQQQNTVVSSQFDYPPQQDHWNSPENSASLQMNYNKGGRNMSWNHPVQQPHYVQQQKFQTQYTNNSEFFEGDPSCYNSGQMSYNTANTAAPDPWNWGWEEPSNVSYPTNNNVLNESSSNWNIQNTSQEQFTNAYSPVQNYFQQGSNLPPMQSVSVGMKIESATMQQFMNEVNTQPNQIYFQEYVTEPQTFNNDKNNSVFSQVSLKPDVGSNVQTLEFQNSDIESSFEVKSETALEDCGLSSEIKTERLSLDSNKIPLTTQALRDFCGDKYENGSVDVKPQSNAEGLTPQWSVESQMSQETVSDDISPSIPEESHSNMLGWDQQGNEASKENNLNTPSRGITQKESKRQVSPPNNQGDEVKSFASKLKENSELNQQFVQAGSFQSPLPPPSGRFGDNSGNNPYSLGHKLSNKQNQAKNLYHKQIIDNISGNECNNLVQQMGKCNISDEGLNQQVISGNLSASPVSSNQEPFKPNKWYEKGSSKGEELPNQETVPDNEERPEAEEHGKHGRDLGKVQQLSSDSFKSQSSRPLLPFTSGSENQEVALRPDRNQYLETGQLEDQMESNSVTNYNDSTTEPLPPPGLSRLVPGEIQLDSVLQSNTVNTLSPPPGLDRMVLGQITENESGANPNMFRNSQNTPPPGLHRMVPGQLTDDQRQNIIEEPQSILSSNPRRDDIPPPGFHRMIPGESSSPETQNIIQMPMDPRERRVVTGVAKDEMNHIQTNAPSPSPAPANRLTNQPANAEENRLQFQSERCETIGSDNVDNYGTNTGDISSAKSSKRKEGKERDRYREDISSDEAEREPVRKHDRDSEYYSKRDRNREREDSSGDRYRDEEERRSKGRERVDWDRERRKTSPRRYREDRSRRREYREDRRRHKDYNYSDEDEDDEDTNEYYSDRERRNTSRYRDDYDRGYSRRDDRARSLRPEKSSKDSNEESSLNSALSSYPLLKYFGQSRNSERSCGKSSWCSRLALSLPIDIRSAVKSRRHGGYSDRDRDLDRDRDRDKDKDRERDRDRDKVRKERDRGSDYYRRRDELDDYSQRSRPSSRNDSMQEYKHRTGRSDYDDDREKEKGHYRGHSKRDRDLFYPPGYNYDPAYYTYYYQYYENLRRTNPIAYAEWFRKYYAQSQQGTFDGTYTEDRGSVHSGRSSANEENKDRYIKTEAGLDFAYSCYQSLIADQNYPYRSHSSETGEQESGRRLDSSLQMESVQRLTPAKFTTAHVKGTLTPRGQLVKILARYPLDGQPATLEVHENLSCFDDLRKEFLNFSGPLVKGVTHKNNILRFCKQKIKDADSNPELFDKESYKLIWELLILLIRQNGTVVGTDIAELLMSNRTAHVIRQAPPSQPNAGEGPNHVNLNEEEVTNQFRDYLIYGNTKEALEWAMKHGLWGHALFLASKMDQRTYASVMTRFANGLTMNDPLQTLYQLMSGRQPASVTCCADEKWGDWRPHLAMILSNSTARPDLDVKAVTTLGDTLSSRGNLYAAHFCYLMAQVEFGTFAHKSSRIVLIGSSHILPFQQFASNEAIFATEIFEFACSLADPDFALHHLQAYKLIMAKRLAEVGLLKEAVHYVEVIANTVGKFPAQYPPGFIQEVYELGNMLKYFDPVYNSSEGAVSDPEWLLQLLNILNDYQSGVLQHDGYGSVSNLTTYSENEGVQNLPLDPVVQETGNNSPAWQNQQQMYYGQQQQQPQQEQQKWQQKDQANYGYQSANNSGFMSVEQPTSALPSVENSNRQYWSNQNQWRQPQGHPLSPDQQQPKESDYLSEVGIEATDNGQNQSLYNYYNSNKNEQVQAQQAPLTGTVTLPNRQRTVSQSSDRKPAQAKPKPAKKEPSKHNQSTGSWFGGIWNKLPFRPKNQMILPDDKNPSIVWDSDKNRWVNLNADEDDAGGPVPPPPKASELASVAVPSYVSSPNTNPTSPFISNSSHGNEAHDRPDAAVTPLPPSGPNKYKMTRGKSLRSNYVDVLNPGAAKAPGAVVPGPPDLFPTINYSSQLPTNYFIPAPVEGNENAPIDFLSPSNAPVMGRSGDNNESSQPQQALSRWSSTSSLSREVQKYTMKGIGNSKMRIQDSYGSNEDYYNKGNSQWSGGPNPARYPPTQTSSLPRSRGYAK